MKICLASELKKFSSSFYYFKINFSGDSGASLVSVKTKKILGVLSYVKDAENGHDIGFNDCKSRVPAVATRIQPYIEWINEKSGLNFKN